MFLALLVAGCLVLASCSESDELGDAIADEDVDTGDDASEGDSEDDGSEEGDEDDAAAAVAMLESQGLSNELAECAVDALVDQGIAPSELDGIGFPDAEMSEALALAGAQCTEFIDGLPAGALDLEDPAVRNGFITSFADASGLSEEVAGCVLDFLVERGVDAERIIDGSTGGGVDAELGQVIQEGVETCT